MKANIRMTGVSASGVFMMKRETSGRAGLFCPAEIKKEGVPKGCPLFFIISCLVNNNHKVFGIAPDAL